MMLDGTCVIIRLSELLSIQRILFILDQELKHPLKKKLRITYTFTITKLGLPDFYFHFVD